MSLKRVFTIVYFVVAICSLLPGHAFSQTMVQSDILGALTQVIPPRGDYVPDLATMIITQSHMKPVRDTEGTLRYEVTVPLRRDLLLSDGSELTAHDVVASYTSILSPSAHGAEAGLSPNPWTKDIIKDLVARVEATDEFTVRFLLKWIPGLGEWQYGLLQHPIVVTRSMTPTPAATLTLSVQSRDFENIVLFKNGSAAISNPVTGYSYLSAGVGGDVELSFERESMPPAQSTTPEYYLGYNLHQGPMANSENRALIAAVIHNTHDAVDMVGDQPLKLMAPTAQIDPDGAIIAHAVASRLMKADLTVSVIQDASAYDLAAAALSDYDLIILRHDVGIVAPPDSLAELFAKAKSVHRWASALGFATPEYRASLSRFVAAPTAKEAQTLFERWMNTIEISAWIVPIAA